MLLLFEEGMISAERDQPHFFGFRIQEVIDWKRGTLGLEDQASHRRGSGELLLD